MRGWIVAIGVSACSGHAGPAKTPEPEPQTVVASAGTPAIAAPVPEESTAQPPSSAPAVQSAAPAPEEPSACPADMVLVEGEYCTDVQQKCLKSWFDKSNKKTVCEEFEPPSVCVGEKVKKRYCIDKYEYPNVAGQRPEVMNNFYQAQVKCAAQDKRMCTETEWTFACEGPEMKPFPHGYVRDAQKCRGDVKYDFPDMKKVAKRDEKELERLWKGVPSGTQPDCVSDFGVADMPGNADEVASSESFTGWANKFDNVTTGGPWYKGVRNQCRPKIYTHDEGFYYYYLSFRCCAEPDGAETDPRAPKQIKRGWSFDRVERLGRLTVEEAQLQQRAEKAARAEKGTKPPPKKPASAAKPDSKK